MKSRVVIITAIALFCCTHVASASCTSITRTLKVGSKGDDVRALQKYLNSDPTTQIAKKGKNSPGKETGAFDAATKRAVVALQKEYSGVILGLSDSSPTGIVGTMTRAIVNQGICDLSQPSTPLVTDSAGGTTSTTVLSDAAIQAAFDQLAEKKALVDTSGSLIDQKIAALSAKAADLAVRADAEVKKIQRAQKFAQVIQTTSSGDMSKLAPAASGSYGALDSLDIFSVVPTAVHPGAQVAIIGSGFLGTNTIHIGGKYITGVVANADGSALLANIPADMPLGKVSVSVENSKGLSPSHDLYIVDVGAGPHLDSASPSLIGPGMEVTLNGSGFGTTNEVDTSIGAVKNLASADGKTLKFTLSPASFTFAKSAGLLKEALSVVVASDSGVSNPLTLQLVR